jgi:hypothetical protein
MAKSTLDLKDEFAASRERLYFLNPLYILLFSTIPVVAGFLCGIQFVLPLFITVPSFFVMRRWLMKGKVGTAYAEMLLSCLWMSIPLVLLPLYLPSTAEKVIFKGPEYVVDMERWINTGGAMEGTPSLFIPEHLIHMAMIILGSILTGGFLALFFGAIQMGYMNYYVAWLIKETGGNSSACLLGWPVWSIIRVFSFVLLAVVLAQPLLHWFNMKRINVRRMFQMIALAIILEGIDIGMKISLGPVNQGVLHRAMEQAVQAASIVRGLFIWA